MKIVVLDGYTENPGDLSWDGFKKFGELSVYDRSNESQIVDRINNSEIVITNKTPITKETMEKCPNIKYIGILATGYNVVDIKEATKRGIVVTNIPNYSTNAVAQSTIALLLEICNRVGHHDKEVRSGRWSKNKDFCFWDYPLIELFGKTIGIIGYGSIGKQTAKIAKAMGMDVIATSRSNRIDHENIAELVDIEYLLKNSDIISLHCPLNDSTYGIINSGNISKMKDGVILLNTARGGLVVEDDLAKALNEGKIYAAGIDVASVEPIVEDNPLLYAKNCIITPHIAWAAKETRQRLMNIAAKNLECFLQGKPQNCVSQ